jgi:UDP-N-acetylmuramate dehydrogenase
VGLSTRHALAIVNAGGATAREVLALMREIQEAVWNLYRVELIPEPVLVGFEEPLSGGIY